MRDESRTNDDGSRDPGGEPQATSPAGTAQRLHPSAPLTYGTVAALQQLAGNRVVAGLIQRQGPPAAPPTAAPEAPLTERYDAAVKAGNWGEAAVLLNGFNDADIQERVNALSAGQRGSMRKATPEWAHRVRTPLLDLDYKAAVADGKWGEAAVLLNGFNAADIAQRVGALSSPQRLDLYVGSPPWAKPVFDAIATADLAAAFKGAIKRSDWERAAVLLNGFNDGDIQSHVAALNAGERASIRKATPEWAHRVRTPLLELDYQAAVTGGNWNEAAVLLNGFNDADIQARVNALAPADRAALRRATPEWAHRIRTPLLTLDYEAAVADGKWGEAAVLLNGFNAADIAQRVGALSSPQRFALYVASPAWAKPVLEAIAAVDLDAAFKGAVKLRDWERAAVLLNGFNDADIQAQIAALSPADRTSLRRATPEWAHRVRTPLLELDYQAAVAAGNWNEAAKLLNGFNDADIAARVSKLSSDQLAALKRSVVAQLGGGADRLVRAIELVMSTAYSDVETKVKALVAAGKHGEALQYLCTTYGFGAPNVEIKVVPPIPGAWATASGEIKEGAKQTLSIGQDLFTQDLPFIVRTIGHEFQHLKQRSQKDPIKNQKEREFLSWSWEALDESVPRYTLKTAAVHAKKALEYYNDMPADRKVVHADRKRQLDALIAKAASTP